MGCLSLEVSRTRGRAVSVTLLEPLRALQQWAIEHLSDVSASQDAYDRTE
jgi:hypothetical protein